MYVRRRDGPKRIEQAYRILIDGGKEANPKRGGAEADAHSGDLREGLHRRQGREQTIDSQLTALRAMG